MNDKKENPDIYYTISSEKRAEIKIKASRFIASAAPAKSKEKAIDFLENIRKEHYDAAHNCFAYIIGQDENEFRAADDGEPAGSAGKPILSTIKKFALKDIIVVVTRYFGGTKLGVGGLVRAYSKAAEEALKLCEKKAVHNTVPVKIKCAYEELSAVKRLIDANAVAFDEEYTDKVEFTAHIHSSEAENFAKSIISNTFGRASVSL